MPGKHLSVVVTRRLPEVVETRLTELFNVKLRSDDTIDAMHDANLSGNITRAVLLPNGADQPQLWPPRP